MKRILSLLIAMALVLSAASAMALGTLSPLLPYTGEKVVIQGFSSFGTDNDPDSPVYKAYQEVLGNLVVEWEVPASDGDTKLNLKLNSGDIPDIIRDSAPKLYRDYSQSGMFLDLNDYKEYMPNLQVAIEANPTNLTYQTQAGNNYFIFDQTEDYPMEAYYANGTLLEQHGIALPTTFEELEAAMDTLLEVEPDVTPFVSYTGWFGYYKTFISLSIGAKAGMYFDLEDKEFKHAILNPDSNYRAIIETLAKWYQKGYLNPEFLTMAGEQQNLTVQANKWGFSFAYGGEIHTGWYRIQAKDPLPIDLVVLPPLPAEGVKPTISVVYFSDEPYWGLAASAKTKYPELVTSYLDALIGPDISNIYQWGVEGESYEVVDGRKQWLPEFLAQGDDYIKKYGIWNINGPRYVTDRDDYSRYTREAPDEMEIIRMYTPKLESGEWLAEYPRLSPTFSDDDTELISQIINSANTVIEQNEQKFVLGQRSFDEWDAYIEEVLAVADLQAAVDIYNNSPQKPDRLTSTERIYIQP